MKKALLFLFFFSCYVCFAQDKEKAFKRIETLCSGKMAGRGYVKNGDHKASEYIAGEFKNAGLLPFGKSYFQELEFAVNTFPGKIEFKLGGKKLTPGIDFIVNPSAPSVERRGMETLLVTAEMLSRNFVHNDSLERAIDPIQGKKLVLLLDTFPFNWRQSPYRERFMFWVYYLQERDPVIVETVKKLTWSVSAQHRIGFDAYSEPVFSLLRSVVSEHPRAVSFRTESEVQIEHKTRNVIAYIPGTQKPDSFLVFSAHYDHLGMMGKKTMFPGANDNASGIAMMLDLAEYFSKNRPRYSVVFIAFCGEEAGLIGSGYYVDHPLFPLEKIRFLINLDLMGSGDGGMMAVNGAVFEKEFEWLKKVNEDKKYLSQVLSRGKAANSDHYWFTEKGVPSFFFYLMGAYSHYHDVHDKPSNLRLDRYEEAFRLIRDFSLLLTNG